MHLKPHSAQERSLRKSLHTHARTVANAWTLKTALFLGLGVVLGIATMVRVEAIRYLGTSARSMMLSSLWLVTVLGLLALVIFYLLLRTQKVQLTSDDELARSIGSNRQKAGDAILNALQLSRAAKAEGISDELKWAAVETETQDIASLPGDLLFPKSQIRRLVRRVMAGVGLILLVYFLTFSSSNAAMYRLVNPDIVFNYPLPFKINLVADSTTLLAGDTLRLSGQVMGGDIDRIGLAMNSGKDSSLYLIPVTDGRYEFRVDHCMSTFQVQAFIENHSLWTPWEKIYSNPLTIRVINRPLVENLSLRIRPPAYTRLPVEYRPRDVLEISGLKGSRITLAGFASKELSQATLSFDSGREILADVDGTHFSASFKMTNPDRMRVELTDQEGVNNMNPLVYPLHVGQDQAPLARILIPGQDVILAESLQLPLRLKLEDDFGFSRLELKYRVIHPDFMLQDTTSYSTQIPQLESYPATQELSYIWDLNQVNLMPDDALEYWIRIWDNNTVDGPGYADSRKWMARLPTMDELFEGISETNTRVRDDQEEVLEIVKDIREKVDELALEVQKDPNLNWSQKQEAQQSIEQVDQLKSQLEKISKDLDEMLSMAEEQNLFSEETLDKYTELQQLMEKLITPELEEAMRRLQEAMDKNNPEDMQMAMEDFQSAMKNFEKSVQRTLEIFKQVEIEQKLDELSQRLLELADRQEHLVNDLDTENAATTASREESISQDYNKSMETAEALEALLHDQENPVQNLVQEFMGEMDSENVSADLDQAIDALNSNKQQQAKPPARKAAAALRNLSQSARSMRDKAQNQMMEAVMSAFKAILSQTLSLSQAQESLESSTQKLARQSSHLRDAADEQMNLVTGLQQLAAEVQALGEKTFAVNQSLGHSMGAAQAHMMASIQSLEAMNPNQSAQSQKGARENLNRMAGQIMNAMQSLQQSGESTGFSDYLQQLQSLAGEQQGLNQETLNQLGMGNVSMLQKLAQRQVQLRQALSQIEKGMGRDSRMLGDLGKIGNEMEAVARELEKKRPSRRISEHQARILNRLLDAQRSATQRDFSKKRKSETARADNIWTSGPALPEDLGEARNQIYEELLFSLKQNYSRDEMELIREYLNQLEAMLNE